MSDPADNAAERQHADNAAERQHADNAAERQHADNAAEGQHADDAAERLQARAAAALSRFVDVRTGDDGSLGFEYGGALCSLRAVSLAPGLEVLSLTSVLAWDRPLRPELGDRVAERNNTIQFGAISVIRHENLADVLLRYNFPAGGLDDEALATMLVLVLSGADESRQGLLP